MIGEIKKVEKVKREKRESMPSNNHVRKYAEGEMTLRTAAEEYDHDLQTFMEILSQKGLAMPEEKIEELQGFERRQYEYIIHKIGEAVRERAGRKQVEAVKKSILAGKLTVQDGAEKLGLRLGDFAILLEADGLLNKKKISRQLE